MLAKVALMVKLKVYSVVYGRRDILHIKTKDKIVEINYEVM